jgi:PRTRC genetic system protein A
MDCLSQKQELYPGCSAPAYHLLRTRSDTFPFDCTQPADYVVAADGIFMRIPYMGMLMHVPVVSCSIRGLAQSAYWCEGLVGAHVPEEKPRREQPFAPLYHVLDGKEIPLLDPKRLYEYVIAGNGVFLRARKRFGEVLMPISEPCELVGLQTVMPYLRLPYPRIGPDIVEHMLRRSLEQTTDGEHFQEILFYILQKEEGWEVIEPEQEQEPGRVEARDKTLAARLGIFVEVHSHHRMDAFFSDKDDSDERWTGIYGVIGRITTQPELRVRVVVDSYTWEECPSCLVFDLPPNVHDALAHLHEKRNERRRRWL